MKFNDPHMIEQTMTTHACELEPLYWLLEDALYDDKKSRARSLLEIILYVAKYKPNLVMEGLQQPFRERLKIIPYELNGNSSLQKREAISIKQPIRSRELPFKVELELKEFLAQNPIILSSAFEDSIKVTGTEVETDGDYRCDIVAESKSVFYPVELKIAQGTHAVVSQCSKYCYYFYRKLRYDRFKKVQGVVIASGFDVWSINELRREGHWIYNILPVPDSNTEITLERIP
ncbi:MAG: hypothetical protein ACXAC5_11720 [Promethearchaeota archaeon]|jgi:hypothetical protein